MRRIGLPTSSAAARRSRGVAVNGKWTSQPVTGTQRYAGEISRRLPGLLVARMTLHIPQDGHVPDWLPPMVSVRRSRLRGTLFEQVALPWAARHDVLVSLGGPAPVAARRQVATMHDATPFRFPHTYSRIFAAWYRFMYRTLVRRALQVITVSEFSAGELADVLHVDRGRFVVAGNGSEHIDHLTSRRPALEGLDGDFVLCIGTFARHKQLAPTLTALEGAGIHSVVVGAAGGGRVFRDEERRGWSMATIAGRLEDGEIAWLYEHAACLVFPSSYEGFGVPIVEAQRKGCPVVAVRAASIPEVAGEGALLVDDVLAIPAAVRLARDPGRRRALVDAGRANADRHTWDESAQRVAALINSIPDTHP